MVDGDGQGGCFRTLARIRGKGIGRGGQVVDRRTPGSGDAVD